MQHAEGRTDRNVQYIHFDEIDILEAETVTQYSNKL